MIRWFIAGSEFSAKILGCLKDQFVKIYATNEWQHGSGEGSLPAHTSEYRAFLEGFIRAHKVRSVVDFGCGDWQSSCLIDWGEVDYLGIDIVPSVIEANRARFQKPNIKFRAFDEGFDSLPSADLLIAKDVLQHWSNGAIERFLPILRRYPYALITNCVARFGRTVNRDIADGDFRVLDLRMPPFDLAAEELFTFTNRRSLLQRLTSRPRWKKRVLLYRSPQCQGECCF